MTTANRGGRVPGFINLAAALAVAALLITFALSGRSATPPAIAEFAPQAQQIKSAPQEQTSLLGQAPNGAVGGPAPSPSASPAEIPPNALLLHCVGDPPRQIEDPQSPPCVPYWSGDNGDGTSAGVTRTAIRVAYDSGGQSQDMSRLYRDLGLFFNSRFEFYGRRLTFVPVPQSVDAGSLRKQYNPFASDLLWAPSLSDLARHGIMSTAEEAYNSNQYYAQYSPYLWQYIMGNDTLQRIYGSWLCGRGLVKGDAVHGGDITLRQSPRKLGLILAASRRNYIDSLSGTVLEESVATCGGSFAKVVGPYSWFDDSVPSGGGTDQNIILNMKQAGVTSIVCICFLVEYTQLTAAADNQAYHPEWLLSSYGYDDFDMIRSYASPDQLKDAFGLTVMPKQVLPANNPAVWATTAEDPGWDWWSSASQFNNQGTPGDGYLFAAERYRDLLLLASGIQMAGANLTPGSFQRSLQATVFPNPSTPIQAGRVGFGPGGYTMTDDAAEIWWSPVARAPDGEVGAYCYVQGGVRHTFDWTAGDPFFNLTGPCDTGAT